MSVNGGAVHDEAVAHVQDAMAVGGGFGIVRDHHDGLAEVFVKQAEKIENGLGAFGIEIAGGFIGEDDLGFADDGAREGDALLFAAGKFRRLVFQACADAEQIGNDLEAVWIESICVNVLRESDVVVGVERGQKIEALKDEADFVAAQQSAGGVAHGGEVVAIEKHAPARGLRQAANHVQHGGFSASRRTHDGDEFAGKDFDVDAAQGGHVHFARAIDLPQIFRLKYGLQQPLPCKRQRISLTEMILVAFSILSALGAHCLNVGAGFYS